LAFGGAALGLQASLTVLSKLDMIFRQEDKLGVIQGISLCESRKVGIPRMG